MTLSVLIADDHAVVREGLAAIIDAQPDMRVCAVAADGTHAIEQAERLRPDVVLLDMRMPVLGGVAAVRAMRQRCPGTRIIIVSMYDDARYVRAAIVAGADDFVGKQTNSAELLAAIRTVHSGERAVAPASDAPLLSEREREVAQLIARGHSGPEIASHLGISKSSVDTYRGRVFRKLGVESRAELVDQVRSWETEDALV